MHKTLTNWKARRAGGRITVNGTDQHGKPAKIVGVDVIQPSDGNRDCVYATDKDGVSHVLKFA